MEQGEKEWKSPLKTLLLGMTFEERVRFLIRYAHAHRKANGKPKRRQKASAFVCYRGELMSMYELARRTGISRDTLFSRIRRHGWTVEEAAETPVRFKKK